jgi:mono/diheme cytochrome c family protein
MAMKGRTSTMWKLRTILHLTTAAFVISCGSQSDSTEVEPTTPAPQPLATTAVAWNPSNVDVGTVQAVAEQDTSVVVFGSKGVLTLTSGSLVSSDASITAWQSAAVVPSSDGLSSWLLGVDNAGRLQRITAGAPPIDVSDRYGLANDKVENVAAGATHVAFLLDSGVAVTDGANITRYHGTARALAANGTAVAVADGAAIRIFDQGKEADVPLADVQLVAYDGAGNLLAATTHALYQVSGKSAHQVFDAGARTIHALAGAGANVWLSVDGDLGLWKDGHVAVGSGGTLAPDARLIGSASGDVWAITGGQLLRWSGQAAIGGDEATWNATVQPVYAAVCSNCHGPPGSDKSSSNIDLSTYAKWVARRGIIYGRVVTQAGTPMAMPPPSSSFTLTDAQRSAINAWSKP